MRSGIPRKYFCRALRKMSSSGETWAKRVMQERNFMSSGEPKICAAERFSTRRTNCVHSFKRAPRTGWAKYARASSKPEIAYSVAVGLRPRPRIWGKMNHIQWDIFLPERSSEVTWGKTGVWASTKRSRLKVSSGIWADPGAKQVPLRVFDSVRNDINTGKSRFLTGPSDR